MTAVVLGVIVLAAMKAFIDTNNGWFMVLAIATTGSIASFLT